MKYRFFIMPLLLVFLGSPLFAPPSPIDPGVARKEEIKTEIVPQAVQSKAADLKSSWVPLLSLKVREFYDSNVYWYSVTSLANQGSWVTSIQPILGFVYKDGDNSFSLKYAPDYSVYHEEADETYFRHKGLIGFHQAVDQLTLDGDFLFSFTQGERDSVIYSGVGGLPALGGYEQRNRRQNIFSDHKFSIRYDFPELFVRGVYAGKYWDFMVREKNIAGYANYYDRNDINGGMDFGRKILDDVEVYLGYRYGSQDQEYLGTVLNAQSFANQYHRVLAGVDGKLFDFIKLDVELGPDFRYFDNNLPSGKDRRDSFFFADANVTFELTKNDSIKLHHHQFLLPSQSGNGMFIDILYQINYSHTFSDEIEGVDLTGLKLDAAFKVYENDFFPGNRRDRVYVPMLALSYKIDNHWSVGMDYQFTTAESEIVNTPAREFDQHIVGFDVTAKY